MLINQTQEEVQMEQSLRNAAFQTDEANGGLDSVIDAGTHAPATESTPGDNAAKGSDLKAPAKAESTDQNAKQKSDSPSTETQAQEQPDPKETHYSKAKKDAERRDKSWKALNEEKAAHQAEIDKIKAEREQFLKERSEWEAKNKPPPAKPLTNGEYSPKELREAALDWAAEGDMKKAKLAYAEADRLEQVAKGKDAEGQSVELKGGQQKTWQQLVGANPELNNPESPISKELNRIMGMKPYLAQRADGAADALEVVKLSMSAARVPVLEKRVSELEAENKKLTKANSLDGSLPSERSSGKSTDSMSLEEHAAQLRSLAMEQDSLVGG